MTTLHATPTNTLYHASDTAGERSVGLFTVYLLDESGNYLTDDEDNLLVARVSSTVLALHAQHTNLLLHAEN